MSRLPFHLAYGRRGCFEFELNSRQLLASLLPPEGLEDVAAAVESALASPLGAPPLRQFTVPGDRVVVVLDRDTPRASELIGGVWGALSEAGVEPTGVTILQPAALTGGRPPDPRSHLPAEVREGVGWRLHDALDESACGYLASTAGGERIYLSRDLLDADLIICVGAVGFDDALGCRGTLSSVYPGLSTADTMRKTLGGGFAELAPDSPRSLRELTDEVGWLLGVPFAVQVVPAVRGGVAAVFAGAAEDAFSAGRQALTEHWQLDLEGRAEFVVVAVDTDAGGHGWPQVAAALDTARRLVARDGRILVLSELAHPPTEAIQIIRDAHTPREALRPIRERTHPDRRDAYRLAQALDRANVYLLSELPDDLVEDLFMVPLASPQEARRLLQGTEACIVVGSAQHAYVHHRGEER